MKKISILFLAVLGFGMPLQGARAEDSGWHKGACKADAQKFCSDAKGRKEVMECMKKHQAELSDSCKSLAQKRHSREKMAPR